MVAVRGARAAPRSHRGLSGPREPLWAEGLARRPRAAEDGFFAEPAPAAPPPARPAFDVFTLVLTLMAVVTFATAGAIVASRNGFTRRTVASSWEDIPMRCDTTRFTQQDHAVELFGCRASDGGRLPPGVYRPPRARWTSDLTGEEALADVIRITPGGALAGVAIY